MTGATKRIAMKDYCPNSPYGYDLLAILKKVVNHEAEIMAAERPNEPLPTVEKLPEFKMTPTAIKAFAYQITVGGIMSILP